MKISLENTQNIRNWRPETGSRVVILARIWATLNNPAIQRSTYVLFQHRSKALDYLLAPHWSWNVLQNASEATARPALRVIVSRRGFTLGKARSPLFHLLQRRSTQSAGENLWLPLLSEPGPVLNKIHKHFLEEPSNFWIAPYSRSAFICLRTRLSILMASLLIPKDTRLSPVTLNFSEGPAIITLWFPSGTVSFICSLLIFSSSVLTQLVSVSFSSVHRPAPLFLVPVKMRCFGEFFGWALSFFHRMTI